MVFSHLSICFHLSGVGSSGGQPKHRSPQLRTPPPLAYQMERYTLSNVPWVYPMAPYSGTCGGTPRPGSVQGTLVRCLMAPFDVQE